MNNRLLLYMAGLLVLALYINIGKVVTGSRYVTLIADAALFALAARVIVARLLNGRWMTALELLTAGFIVLGVIQIFNPNVPTIMAGIEGFRRLVFQMLGVFIGIAVVRNRDDLIFLYKVVAVASVPILLYAIKQFFFVSDFDTALIASNTADIGSWKIFGKLRAFGIFNGPFHLGLFAGFSFWLGLGLFVETRRKIALLLAGVALAAGLATLTRGSVIAILASCPVVLFYVFNRYRVRVAVIAVAAIVVASSSVALLRSSFEELDLFMESFSSLENVSEDNRLMTRFEGYERGLSVLKSHPLGTGMGSSGDAMKSYFEPYGAIHVTSHNLLLRIALETGFPGLVLFLFIVGWIGYAVVKLKESDDNVVALVLLGMCLIVAITGITGSTLGAYPVNLVFWSLCGGAAGCALRLKGKIQDVSRP
ncbi:MAG: O-antigen ligase family protein [bacterium]|nr:O-antigen ligase family protein [bacterium]